MIIHSLFLYAVIASSIIAQNSERSDFSKVTLPILKFSFIMPDNISYEIKKSLFVFVLFLISIWLKDPKRTTLENFPILVKRVWIESRDRFCASSIIIILPGAKLRPRVYWGGKVSIQNFKSFAFIPENSWIASKLSNKPPV